MSQFLPEGFGTQPADGVSSITPANPETTSDDIALMQRVLSAASRNPNLIPTDFMAYLFDFIQTQRLEIPIGQVFGYQSHATQVITDFAAIPSPSDGQTVLLRCGSSAPFTYVEMVYDYTAQHWVSPEFGLGSGSFTGGGGTSPTIAGIGGAISWAPVTSGLTMQAKWSGYAVTSNNSPGHEAHAGIYLFWGNFGSGFTTSTMSDQSTNSLSNAPLGQDWTSVSNPGNYAVLVGGIYGYHAAVGDVMSVFGGAVGRFIF